MRKMMKPIAFALAAMTLTSCSILPKENNEPEGPQYIEMTRTEEQQYLLTAQVEALMELPPMLSEAEKKKLDMEKVYGTPYSEPEKEMIDYCKAQAESSMAVLMQDFPSENYKGNRDERVLKDVFDGKTSVEVNGGLDTVKIGAYAGYWRIANCNYYNMAFFTDEANDENVVKTLFRADAYYYGLNDVSGMVNGDIGPEITVDNSTMTEYKDAFLVVTQTNITPNEVSKGERRDNINEKVLLFKSYDEAVESFLSPEHTFEDLYVGDQYQMMLIDGYQGKPVILMPELRGKYIDVSQKDKIRELEELNVKNYRVEWVNNINGEMVPYSIVDCSVPTGEPVDITNMDKEKMIVVKVAMSVEESVPEKTE